MAGRRIDTLLVELGHCPTREKAQRAIMAGSVFIGTDRVKKASQTVPDDRVSQVRVETRDHAVSRAYYKLEKAFDLFGVRPAGRPVLDVGASTGGFTQLLLERGANPVWAVDCGSNQLAWSIRTDPRVIVMEKTNARHLLRADLEREAKRAGISTAFPDLAVMDVSFISVSLILPVLVQEIMIPEYVILIKPQFEAGRSEVGPGGIVRDPETHKAVLERILRTADVLGLGLTGLTWSPIAGGDGNIEFLAHLTAGRESLPEIRALAGSVVAEAHQALGGGRNADPDTGGL
ncbi:MAG TPA: TlyA family RNA methyltransferase [Spirochaetota bacterium]|nr:TlyA family RNA methyltransferase [Spirochaetota bacterium]HPN82877.1 TlyA family RNA methyltransferase [Spirochaetota bacterium]